MEMRSISPDRAVEEITISLDDITLESFENRKSFKVIDFNRYLVVYLEKNQIEISGSYSYRKLISFSSLDEAKEILKNLDVEKELQDFRNVLISRGRKPSF